MKKFYHFCGSWQDVVDGLYAEVGGSAHGNLSGELEALAQHCTMEVGGSGSKEQFFLDQWRHLMEPQALSHISGGEELRAARMLADMAVPFDSQLVEHIIEPMIGAIHQVDTIFHAYSSSYRDSARAINESICLLNHVDLLVLAGVPRCELASELTTPYVEMIQPGGADAIDYLAYLISHEPYPSMPQGHISKRWAASPKLK